MKDRGTALKKAIRTRDPTDKRNARKSRNRVNILVRNVKNGFIKEKLETYADNPKNNWEQIKSIFPNSNLSNPIILKK